MRPIPTSVRVGYRTYTIEDWPTKHATSANRYGEVAHGPRVIRVETTHGALQAAESLLHEIRHCICVMWCRDDDAAEEKTVSIMSTGLATVWHDNPDVMAWITEGIAEGRANACIS